MNFYATIAEHISVNRKSVVSLSSDSGVHNIEIYIDLNYELNNVGIKCPYVMDGANPQDNQGMIVDSIESQVNKLITFLYNIKYLWATHTYGGVNKILLCNQVRNGLYKLFEKSPLNDLIGNSLTSTSYLDIYKIIDYINAGDLFYSKMVSLTQLKQILDGVADSGDKYESTSVNGIVSKTYKFNEGDSLNCILIVNDTDVSNGIVNADKWIISLVHKNINDNVLIIPYNVSYKYISNLNALIKTNSNNTFSVSFDNSSTWTPVLNIPYSGINFIGGKYQNNDVIVYYNNTTSVYISYDGITYSTLTSKLPIFIVYYSILFNKYYGIQDFKYYYSTDLINWTLINELVYNVYTEIYSFAESSNKLTVGAIPPVFTLDGVTWQNCIFAVPSVNPIVLTAIINSPILGMVATGVDNITGVTTNYISIDGITWHEKVFIPGSYIVFQQYLPINGSYIGISVLNDNIWTNTLSNELIVYNTGDSYNVLVNSSSNASNSAYNIVLINSNDLNNNSSIVLQSENLVY